MFTRHVSRNLAAYVDGGLSPVNARQTEIHLEQCASCQGECDQVRRGMAMVEHLSVIEAPEAIWFSIEAALQYNQQREIHMAGWWRWALAATFVLALAGGAFWRLAQPAGARWEVVRLDGSPSVAAKPIGGKGQVGAGEWIETDARSRAVVKVGEIGSVEIAPNTLVGVVTARPGEHRLALVRGEIRAKITAPPRLFFVNTASGTAVDLGCEYTLHTSEDGFGTLQVTKGWVAFEWKGLESLVPAGASCQTRPKLGPGIPYFDDAPESVRRALEAFSIGNNRSEALSTILSESRVRDTLTLWHLLSRVEGGDRGRVFDRIAALTPVPAGVSREQVLELDPETLRRWKEELAWTW